MSDEAQARAEELELECLDFIARSGLKLTEPRKVILRACLHIDGAFDAEKLLEESRKEDSLISLTTVYRTLPILLKSGILRKVLGENEKQLYELNAVARKTITLIHVEDDSTEEIEDDCLWLRIQFLAKQKGYIAKNIDVRIDVEKARTDEG